MGTSELNSPTHRYGTRNDKRTEVQNVEAIDSRKPRPECISVLKVYDGCTLKECLDDLGPARLMDKCECTGNVVHVPENADDVAVDCVRIREINIRKQPNRFKASAGYWDIFLEFVFEYRLTFFRNNEVIDEHGPQLWACGVFRKRVTLFSQTGGDIEFAADFLSNGDVMCNGPFVSVEAKAIALCAKIGDKNKNRDGRREVFVTIGLYAIIRLLRIVNLSVESRGFCEIPEQCECADIDCVDPCEFFNGMDFPADLFNPSAKQKC